MKPEPVRYAWNGDISLAYQVVGNGPLDLLICFGYMSNLDVQWESPYLSRFLRRLAEGARVIVTDRRGWGCSDRFSPTDVPALEALAADLPAVLDAAGSERAVVLATMESGMIAQFFAASHPERVAGLILLDSLVSWSATPETPWMPDPPWGSRTSSTCVPAGVLAGCTARRPLRTIGESSTGTCATSVPARPLARWCRAAPLPRKQHGGRPRHHSGANACA